MSPRERTDEALLEDGLSPEEWEASWDEELTRRIGEVERGEVALLDHDQVMAKIRKKYGWS